MDRDTLQKALEISFDRWSRSFQKTSAPSFVSIQESLQKLVFRLLSVLGGNDSGQETNLFGPAFCTICYSFLVCWGQFYVLFWVFATWIFGSLIVFLLFRLLGSSHGFVHVTASVGYAIAPLAFLEPLMTLTEEPLPGLSFVIKCVAVLWASRSASLALVQPNTEKKVFLFECPLILFNIYLLSLRSGA